jgi:hypothetical protein
VKAWFLWGERRPITVKTVIGYLDALKPLFTYCSLLPKPIAVSSLHRFPELISDDLVSLISPSFKRALVRVLDELYISREELGFIILAPAQIADLARQTPYVPPRIWLYQASRTKLFLEDYLAHRDRVEVFFRDALAAYVHNYGDVARAIAFTDNRRNPFQERRSASAVKLGNFVDAINDYGISDLLRRWTLRQEESWDRSNKFHSVRKFSRYLNQVVFIGHHHLIAWSGMRDSEASTLRADSLIVEDIPELGRVYSLKGCTSKTVKDDDARWVTGPEAEVAVTAMASVARLRMEAARCDPRVSPGPELENPYLETLAYEPWCVAGDVSRPVSFRPRIRSIGSWRKVCSNLFEESGLRITAEDARIARLVEPSLCSARFSVGQQWHFHAHQFRRSILVNMAGSGVVSLEAQQLQAKHVVKQQTVYYNRGFSALRFNQTFANELIAEVYLAKGRTCQDLQHPHWVSPFGPERKSAVLARFHHSASAAEIAREARRGTSTVRLTLFGVCTRRDQCPYGGWDDYAHCPTCAEALLDTRRRPAIAEMGRTIAIRLADAPAGTPLRAALEIKLAAVEEALNVND